MMKDILNKWRQSFRSLGWDRKVLLSAALLAAIPALLSLIMQKSETPQISPANAPAVDTMIPRGHVLVPIEVQNYEALDSILGRFGIVDLFQAASEAAVSSNLVARNVRILRAPQNPTHFAILVREQEVNKILKYGSLFTVVVKRPEQGGTEFVNTMKPKRRKIVYEGG
jgi:hypothetical protein